jgi:DNA-binding transcriptional MocR family regulator
MIEFHLDQRSGVATYLQIVQQTREALRLGLLDVGDQLPTVREVVASLAINPNTSARTPSAALIEDGPRLRHVFATLRGTPCSHRHAIGRWS